ncbi:hypothetical protein JCM19237_39 [Photobacterium aphoticum]|uniref:Uncharacterized protein n=1 Tax=Photobacterium aphoticum TaxID=754436 RepID=A0A090R1Q4_9GAMM|nr:hypothetical protein JCM19237_39 [Photobacterium aphoticum]
MIRHNSPLLHPATACHVLQACQAYDQATIRGRNGFSYC